MDAYEFIVVGCGFAGAVCARELAEAGNRVLILEKRNHIAGNMYDSIDETGILIHSYGPHIFHTNEELAFNYLKRFQKWNKYEHRVLARIKGKLVPVPFNFTSVDSLFEEKEAENIKTKLKQVFPKENKLSILDLIQSEDKMIKEFGKFVYDNLFAHYTAKQWGTPISEVDKGVLSRVPIVLGYDNRYFQDKFQFMPEKGFTDLFENLLSHPKITILLGEDALKCFSFDIERKIVKYKGKIWNKPVIYTGPIDELFKYKFGTLPYRSIDFVFEHLDLTYFQPAPVINYPNKEKFTRITEFKYLTGQMVENKTTILKEYSIGYDPRTNQAYYPVINDENLSIFDRYKKLTESFGNIFLCGRLAEYEYYNMDAVILRALKVAKDLVV